MSNLAADIALMMSLGVLRQVEWRGKYTYGQCGYRGFTCPLCGAYRDPGTHKSDCALGRVLAVADAAKADRTDQPWHHDHRNLAALCRYLTAAHGYTAAHELHDVIAKPWKWAAEWEELQGLARSEWP